MSQQQQQKGGGETAAAVPGDNSKKILEDAKGVVKLESFYMKRCLDSGKLMDALKHASNMASELRTSLLSPKDYYALYMVAFDELRHLESYLYDERERHGKKMAELYELVQYAGNIVPRMYLLVTVASAYIRSKEAPVKDILRDTVEMCRGVQHPTRGLFLRNYLSEVTKDKLPDVGADSAVDGDVKDSVEFILNNFAEMNKLWVRLHMGPARERERREGERQELRILVGKNLSRISQLEGVDADMYKTVVLPRVLEQVVSCHDRLAQQYLMEIVVQVFPDDFHLCTLDQLLSTCTRLVPKVDVKSIVHSLIDRLARFVASSPSSVTSAELFGTLERYIEQLAAEAAVAPAPAQQVHPGVEETTQQSAKARLTCPDYLSLQVALETLCLKCFPDTPAYINEILGNVDAYLTRATEADADAARGLTAVQQLTDLLSRPVEAYNDVLRVLSLSNYAKIPKHLNYAKRKSVQVALLRNAVANGTALASADHATLVLSFAAALVRDEPDQPDPAEIDKDDFDEEQHLVASVVHLYRAQEPEALYNMYFVSRKFFGVGGKDRIRHTLPPLVFAVLRLASQQLRGAARPLADDKKKFGNALFTFVNETVKAMHGQGYAESALRLHLQAAQAASACGFETAAYEFVSEAMSIYEDDIAGSAEQFAALTLIMGTLYTLQFSAEGAEGYETLITKAAKHSLKLMRKPDQCRAVCMSSHLFWRGDFADGKRVLECLQKSLKIADSSMNATTNVGLFVEILNQYIYYFERKNEAVTVKYLTGLISLINTNIANVDSSTPEAAGISAFYKNTLAYIAARKAQQQASDQVQQPLYAAIDLQ